MDIGDVIETAIWITGDESKELRAQYERDVCDAINEACLDECLVHGPVKFTEKRPGEHRVPPVPEHVKGSQVRLLVGEAEIIANMPQSSVGSFVANLDRKDLIRLRRITRQAHHRRFPKEDALTDPQCDEIIEELGPEAAIDTLRRASMQ